jgi:hypothetical protein
VEGGLKSLGQTIDLIDQPYTQFPCGRGSARLFVSWRQSFHRDRNGLEVGSPLTRFVQVCDQFVITEQEPRVGNGFGKGLKCLHRDHFIAQGLVECFAHILKNCVKRSAFCVSLLTAKLTFTWLLWAATTPAPSTCISPEIAVPPLLATDLLVLRAPDANHPMTAMGTAIIAAIHDKVSSIGVILPSLAQAVARELFLRQFYEQSC